MEPKYIHELYAYNRWADQRVLAAASPLDAGQFTRPLGSSFSSVRDTLVHILSAEWIWLERWLGRAPTQFLNVADFPSIEPLRARWRIVAEDYHQFLHTLTPEYLIEPLAYLNRTGERWVYPLWQQMVHVVNHSTYHRGQITTLLRQLGAEPATTDLLVYYDERNR